MDAADPAFPRATAYWWFGCRGASRGTLGNIQWKNKVDFSLYSGNLEEVSTNFPGGDAIDSHDGVDDLILDAGT